VSEWQPIETAPRDGTWVLVVFPAFANPPDGTEPASYNVAAWDEREEGFALFPGTRGNPHRVIATHWMPLPPAPIGPVEIEPV
jgi:hypothetical protein